MCHWTFARNASQPHGAAHHALRSPLLLATLHLAMLGAVAQGQTKTWINPGLGNWTMATNWSPAGQPGPSNNAVIDNGGTARVNTTGRTAQNVFVGQSGSGMLLIDSGSLVNELGRIGLNDGSTGTVLVSGAGSAWTNSGHPTINFVSLLVGGGESLSPGGMGELTIEEGASVVAATSWIGASPDSIGTVTVIGAGSSWTNEFLVLGRFGTGELTIADGGSVSVSAVSSIGSLSGSTDSTATVTGAGSTWESVGFQVNFGKLTITNGGSVSSDTGRIGISAGSTGTVMVEGGGSIWTIDDSLQLGAGAGAADTGTLAISDGGSVVVGGASSIGALSNSIGEVTVSGTNSTWVSGALNVGNAGTGTATISAGGGVSNASGTIGNEAGSVGTVSVSGPGSNWTNDGNLIIGFEGAGTLTFEDGGSVSNSHHGFIGRDLGAVGTVVVRGAGSTWNNETHLFVGGKAALPGGEGTLTIEPGGTVTVAGILRIWDEGEVNLDGGTLSANTIDNTNGGAFHFTAGTLRVETFSGNLVNQGGTLAPGSSPGITTIDGDYAQQPGGVLEIEVGGLTPGTEHDQLIVTGTATLGGRLDVPLIDGFLPAAGDEVLFLTAGERVGTFSSIFSPNLAVVNPNVALDVVYGPTDARLRFVAPSTDIQFNASTAVAGWADPATWTTGTVPGAANILVLENLDPAGEPQRVNVAVDDSFAHQLTVAGGMGSITMGVQNGRSLSVVSGVTVGERGLIELDGGNLVSPAVTVEDGGELSGSGTLRGNLHVGTTGGQRAKLHPGIGTTPGLLTIDGDYRQGSSGMLVLDVEGIASGQFGTIHATGEVELGGTLQVNAANLTNFVPGMTFEAIRAGSLLGGSIFDDVETIGRDDIFFAPIYPPGFDLDPDPGTGSAVGTGSVFLIGFEKGDMNQDGTVDQDDVPFFALALRDPEAYLKHPQPNGAPCFCHDGQRLGDFTGNGRVDFDDIPHFAERVGMSVPAMLAAIAAYDQAVPEPSTSILAALAAAWFAHGRRRRRAFACLLPLALLGPASSADAAPARFWLSTSSENSSGPEAPSIVSAPGSIHQLHLWVQPATVKDDEPYHPVDNPFKQLQNLSLNLVTNPLLGNQAVIDYLDEAITVYNPVLPGNGRRYEFVHDSTSGLRSTTATEGVLAGIPDGIRGVQGFSLGIDSDEQFVGIGPDPATGGCRDGDLCVMTIAGPAWLVASLSFQIVADSGSADYFLQIGRTGISHAGETTGETLVVFGVDSQPVYNAGFVNAESTHREKFLPGATVDFRVRAGEALPGDFNGDGVVDAADYTIWRDGLGTAFTAEHYAVWKGDFGLAIGSAVGGAPASVPEPTAAGLLTAVWLLYRRGHHRLVEG